MPAWRGNIENKIPVVWEMAICGDDDMYIEGDSTNSV